MRSWKGVAGALMTLLGLAACGGSGSSTTTSAGSSPTPEANYTVRFGSVGGLTDAGIYLAESLGYFKQAGITVQATRMGGGSALTTALASGNLDVAGIAVTAGLFNSTEQGINLKIVGDKNSMLRVGGVATSATHIVVRSDLAAGNETQTLRNLKGKTVGVTDKTSAATANLDMVLRKHGMSINNVNLKVLDYPSITAGLLNGSLDGAVELEPFLSQALQSGKVKDASDETELLPTGATSATQVPIVFSEDFIQKHHATAQAFMTAYMKGVRAYNDAFFKKINKDNVVTILSQQANQPKEVILNEKVAGLDPNQTVNVAYLNQLENWFVQQGDLQTKVNASKLVDTSFAKESTKKLGTYKF